MNYIEYTILTTTEASDAVAYLLEKEGAIGIAIEDPHDFLIQNTDKKSWDYVDPSFLEILDEDVKVKGYFAENIGADKIETKVKNLSSFGLKIGKGLVRFKEVKEEDWANAWKKYFKPFKASKKLVIKPSWEEYKAKINDVVIEMDPGMAFGTGSHETTLMCLKLIEKYIKPSDLLIDVGCGSGILGIASAKLGAKKVLCIDYDDNACKVAHDNVLLNNVQDIVKVQKGNLLNLAENNANIIVANIIADVIIDLCEEAYNFLKPQGHFLSSGIIKDRKEDVVNKLKNSNFSIVEILEMGEWCAIVTQRY